MKGQVKRIHERVMIRGVNRDRDDIGSKDMRSGRVAFKSDPDSSDDSSSDGSTTDQRREEAKKKTNKNQLSPKTSKGVRRESDYNRRLHWADRDMLADMNRKLRNAQDKGEYKDIKAKIHEFRVDCAKSDKHKLYGDNRGTIPRGNKDNRGCGCQPERYQPSDRGHGSPSDPDSSGDGDDTSSGDGNDDEDQGGENSDRREQGECISVSNRLNSRRVNRSKVRHGRFNVFRAPPEKKNASFDGYHESYENWFRFRNHLQHWVLVLTKNYNVYMSTSQEKLDHFIGVCQRG